MDLKLSDLVDRSIRFLRSNPGPADAQRAGEIVHDVLRDIGMFARDMERTEVLHADDPMRQLQERAMAAERLYGRMIDPPRADNVQPMPNKGLQGIVILEAFR
jgi:hypothetical protein